MKTYLLAACMAATMLAAGCGDDNSDTPTGGTGTGTGTGTAGGGSTGGGTTSGCTQTSVATRDQAALDRNGWESVPFTTSTDGRVDITVSWQNSNANIGAFLVNSGSCSQAQFQAQACTFILASGEDQPHQMSGRVAAGSYELLLQNFGGTSASAEPVSATIVLSAGESCPDFPSASPSPSPSPTTVAPSHR